MYSHSPVGILTVLFFGISLSTMITCSSPIDPCTDMILGECDIREDDCQTRVFCLVDQIRGNETQVFPPVRFINELEYTEYLLATIQQPNQDTVHWDTVLSSLYLIPLESTLAMEWTKVQISHLVAYYSPASYEIVYIERDLPTDPLTEMSTLAHEYVHVLQDRERNLEQLWSDNVINQDSDLAARALVEGEAALYQTLMKLKIWDKAPKSVDWDSVYGDQLTQAQEQVSNSHSPMVAAAVSLPYPLGAQKVTEVWLSGGNESTQALYSTLPDTLLEWMDEAFSMEAPFEFTETPDVPDGFDEAFDESLGAGILFAFLTALDLNADDAWQDALNWRADRLSSFRNPSGTAHRSVWEIHWKNEQAALEFLNLCEQQENEDWHITISGTTTSLYTTVNVEDSTGANS